MKFLDLLAMSLKNLSRRKLRTALTVLGVVIGTASSWLWFPSVSASAKWNRELISLHGSLTEINVEHNGRQYKVPCI